MIEKKHSHSLKRFGAKVALSTLSLATPFYWTAKHTDNFSVLPGKSDQVTNTRPLTSVEARSIDSTLYTHFNDVIAGYNQRDHQLALTPEERSFAREHYEHYELLAEARMPSGFYGALLHDTVTHQVLLNFAGMNFSGPIGNILADAPSAFISTTGGTSAQTTDALRFATQADAIAKKINGHGVDYVTGHSLGAWHAAYAAGTNACKHAQYIFYDGPGVTTAMVARCMELSGASKQSVTANFKRCISFSLTHNTYNTLGQQPGDARTLNNDANTYKLFPNDHIYDDMLHKMLAARMQMEKTDRLNGDHRAPVPELRPRTNNEQSPTPPMLIDFFLLAALVPWLKSKATSAINDASANWQKTLEQQKHKNDSKILGK